MSHGMDFLDMVDEEPDNNSSDFLRNFLARWQKYASERLTMKYQESNLILYRMMQIVQKMKDAADFRQVLELILDTGLQALPAEKSYLLLRYADGKLRIALSKGAYSSDQGMVADAEFIQRVLRNRESICIGEPHDESAHTLLEQNFRWFIPVRSSKKFFGILYIEGKERHNTPDKFVIGQLLAELAAEAISKSHLIQQNVNAWNFVETMQQKVIHYDRLAMRGKLSAPIGHELNNLLTIVSGNLEMIKSGLKKGEAGNDMSEQVDQLAVALQNAGQLVQELCGSLNSETLLERCSLNQIVTTFIELVRPLYQKKKIHIVAELDENVPDVHGDSGQIRQILFNMVNNAVQARRDVTITISTSWVSEEGRVKLRIKDNGPGIVKEKLKQLFNPNYTQQQKGHGFGLAICKEIIERHRGAISVESVRGKGTEFIISLPQYQPK
ncbi:GHKL domain-containing protein [candidate division KSB1 bacterium]|nr:GHKL domain-containing protein [candidate division KSB1 bacterium]